MAVCSRDIYSRAVVGWSIRDRLTADLVIDAFNQTVKRRYPQAGLIFHSDRGVQYACSDFRNLLKKYQAVQSMSGKGNCYDNAVSGSFFYGFEEGTGLFRALPHACGSDVGYFRIH